MNNHEDQTSISGLIQALFDALKRHPDTITASFYLETTNSRLITQRSFHDCTPDPISKAVILSTRGLHQLNSKSND